MFPDIRIAEGFYCGKIQTVIKSVLAPVLYKKVTKACVSSPFTILCDGRNEEDIRKSFCCNGKILG